MAADTERPGVFDLARQFSEVRLDTVADHPEAWPWTGFRPALPRRPLPRPGIGHDVIAARLDALRPRDGTVALLMRGAALPKVTP